MADEGVGTDRAALRPSGGLTGTPGAGYQAAFEALKSAQKTSRGAGAYSRFVNRPLGRRIAARAFVLGLTPDMVTMISALLTVTGITLLVAVPPSWGAALAVALALGAGYAFDSADGQLARLRGGGSLAGEWLDHMVDCAKLSVLHLAVLVGVARFFDVSRWWLVVPMLFTATASVKFFGKILNDQLRRDACRDGVVRSAPAPGKVRLMLVAPTDYGLLIVGFLIWPLSTAFLAVYATFLAANFGFLVLALPRWFKEMRALDGRAHG